MNYIVCSLINYNNNIKKEIISFNYIKILYIFFLKIKNKKTIYFINIKQSICFFFFLKKWKKFNLKNNILFFTNLKKKIISNIDGIFKLFLISKKYAKNNIINLENLFLKLKNLIWTNIGCYEINDFLTINFNKINIILESIDKIPFLTKYYIPKNIRISNLNRVRLGSNISEGVTIMSEGYVNFNTYIGKNCMIEGRVSSGVYVSNDTDIGGSCSIMGTLSGGGSNIISIGKKCLLGANSGIGISLGNNCIIESGLYITSGSKIFLTIKKKIIVKAKTLSFVNNLIFLRNSINGKIECYKNFLNLNKINKNLHSN